MADYLTAEEAAKFVAPFVGLSYEADRDKLFTYLHLAERKAWKQGTYKGFLKEFDCKIFDVNGKWFIKTPHGYDVLMGVNINCAPVHIKDSYFQFHHNSAGSLKNDCALSFTELALDYIESPTTLGPEFLSDKTPFRIGIKSTAVEDDGAFLTVDGLDHEEKPIYSYPDVEGEPVHGLQIKLSHKEVIAVDNVMFSSITNISKQVTNGRVEVYRLSDDYQCVDLIAEIQPNQKRSKYRMYQVPKWDCECMTVHCLFKVAEPEFLAHPTQKLIIEDREAILSLTMSLDETYDKKNIEVGETLLTKGIINLDTDLNSSKANSVYPVQYVGLDGEEVNNELDYI